MATTPNYGWVTPAPTDFVTDLPADFETFADAVDADLAGLLGGTTGQVLAKDSNTDHDFSWTTVAGAPGAWTLINAGGTALTGATRITVSGISGYDYLFILIDSGSSASASSLIEFEFNTPDTGHYARGQKVTAGSTYSASNFDGHTNAGGSGIDFARMSGSAGSEFDGYIFVYGANQTGIKPFHYASGVNADGNNSQRLYSAGGYFDNASPISTVSLKSGTGNFDNGTIYVYGR